MKYLCPDVPWAEIQAVGFDLDGTLYDEFDFISQAYAAVAVELRRGRIAAGRCCMGLAVFRACQPVLTLSARVGHLLADLAAVYPLFLISDGHARLQRAKLEALGADRFFRPENIFVSGDRGAAWHKPSTDSVREVAVLAAMTDPRTVVYVGDRDRDREFAARAGFHFVHVSDLFVGL